MAVTWQLDIGGTTVTDVSAITIGPLTDDALAASRFSFTEYTKHYAGSYDEGDLVEFWNPVTDDPWFVGYIVGKRSIGAAGGEAVTYECVNRRGMARNVQVRARGPDETDPNDYPRRIYNAPDDDPDKAYNSGSTNTMTVGEILEDLFDSFETDLLAEGVIELDDPATETGYKTADTNSMTYVPGKIVLEDMNFEQAVVTVIGQQGPTWRIWINTITAMSQTKRWQRWRFYDSQDDPDTVRVDETTITLDTDAVIQNNLSRDLRNRFTAVKIYGNRDSGDQIIPNQVGAGTDEAGASISGVTESWSATDESNWTRALGAGKLATGLITGAVSGNDFTVTGAGWDVNAWQGGDVIFPTYSYAATYSVSSNTSDTVTLGSAVPVATGAPFIMRVSQYGDVFREFQITDSTKRDIVVDAPGEMADVCCPHVEVIHRNSSGDVVTVQNVDVQLLGDGKFRTKIPLFTSPSNGREAGDSSTVPDWRFVYCYRDTTTASQLTARYPSSGYGGDANGAPWSISREQRIVVDEYEDQQDSATYDALAQELHKLTSRVLVSGSFTLAGLDWANYRDLRLRVHFSHSVDSTGWTGLGAPVSSVTYDLEQQTTTVQVSDTGSADGVDYGPILERIRRQRELDRLRDKEEHRGDYVRCQETAVGRSRAFYSTEESEPSDNQTETQPTLVYEFPREIAGGITEQNSCLCDILTDPCNNSPAQSYSNGQFLCRPDDQHGLILKHTGSARWCADSQILRYDTYTLNGGVGEAGMYFPILCKGVTIGGHPDNSTVDPNTGNTLGRQDASCETGLRDIVTVEPYDVDPDNEVTLADYVIQLANSYQYYMQRNEEAHCCLDNRIACVDKGVWGGVGCWNAGTPTGDECETTVLKALTDLNLWVHHLEGCIKQIRQGTGPFADCDIPDDDWNFTGCGPC